MDINKLLEEFNIEVTKIKADRYSGSVVVLNSLINSLSKLLNTQADLNAHEFSTVLSNGLNAVRSFHNQFSALTGFLDEIEKIIDKFPNNLYLCRDKLNLFIFAYTEKWKNVNNKIAKNIFRHIDLHNKVIFLHSNSSTVGSLFELMKARSFYAEIIQTESRPRCEGKIQAKHMSALGYKVTYIVDSAMAKYLSKADLVIVGADAVFPKFFINKIGTGNLAALCKLNNIPMYVLADSRKFETDFLLEPERRKPASEIWLNPISKNIAIENFYFESIANKLITAFITESKIIDPSKQ